MSSRKNKESRASEVTER